MDLRTEMLKIYEANYPETLRRIFIINGTSYLTLHQFTQLTFFLYSTKIIHCHF